MRFLSDSGRTIDSVELVMERTGGFGIHFSNRFGTVLFTGFWGTFWLASFLVAFRIVFGKEIWSWLFRFGG